MDNIISLLPTYERNSVVLNEILTAENEVLEERDLRIEDIEKQMSISTATWALEYYEKALSIKTDLSKSYEDRRSVIKSKRRGTGKVDQGLIKLVVDSYTNGNVDIYFNGNIVVKFVNIIGTPPNIQDAYNSVEDIIPCHLRAVYEFAYLLIRDINNMTLNELENQTLDKFAFGGDRS